MTRLIQDFRRAIESGDPAVAERACRDLLERQPGHAEALTILGNLLLDRDELQEAARCYEAADRAGGAPESETRVYRQERMNIEQVRLGNPYLREFSDVLVDTACWTVMQGNALYSHDTLSKNLMSSPFVRGRISRDGVWAIAGFAPPRTTIDEPCLLVCGDRNYCHWLLRNLLKLSAAERDGRLYERPWLMNRDLTPYQEEYLGLLGVPASRRVLVEREQVIACRDLLVPGLLISKKMVAYGIQWLQRRLAPLMTPRANATARIFVSRSDAPQRYLLNEDQLFARLEALGFVRVVPGQLSVEEQVRIFSAANVIVGVHGAGMTNIAFSPPGSAVVEINSSALLHMAEFRRIAGAAGHRMETVVSEDYPPHAYPVHVNSDYSVDIDKVLEALETATAGRIRACA